MKAGLHKALKHLKKCSFHELPSWLKRLPIVLNGTMRGPCQQPGHSPWKDCSQFADILGQAKVHIVSRQEALRNKKQGQKAIFTRSTKMTHLGALWGAQSFQGTS